MFRQSARSQLDFDPEFRWRGDDVSRIENLSDIVFAIAFGMVVSAASLPRTFEELNVVLLGIIPIAAAFTILTVIWFYYFKYFRRIGVITPTIIWINAFILFTVLYLAYPMRFSFEGFFAFIRSLSGHDTMMETMRLTWSRSGRIMAFFAAGFGFAHFLFGCLYAHALRIAPQLDFTRTEFRLIREDRFFHFGFATLAVLVTLLAEFSPLYGTAGFLFFGSWPLSWLSARYGKRWFARQPEVEPNPPRS